MHRSLVGVLAAIAVLGVAPLVRSADDAGAALAPDAGAGGSAGAAGAGASRTKVVNIGMHIGGGPNDDETKAPIARSVAPSLGTMGDCFANTDGNAEVDLKRHPIDFGVDLTIEAAGGKAAVANPRTTWKNDPFVACVVDVFKNVDFEKPKTGRSVVSYSVRFLPPAH
jgi:hypothetical protein